MPIIRAKYGNLVNLKLRTKHFRTGKELERSKTEQGKFKIVLF